ncbi:hypothetical protein BJX70DRAFT_358141 [Aspergillus crustosus]
MNPNMRTIHENPREESLSIFERITGMTIPPIEEPETARPMAAAPVAKSHARRPLSGAGETNVKGYLLIISLVTAHVEGLMRGLEGDKLSEQLVDAIENLEQSCLPILESMATAQGQEVETVSGDRRKVTPIDMGEYWSFFVSSTALSMSIFTVYRI